MENKTFQDCIPVFKNLEPNHQFRMISCAGTFDVYFAGVLNTYKYSSIVKHQGYAIHTVKPVMLVVDMNANHYVIFEDGKTANGHTLLSNCEGGWDEFYDKYADSMVNVIDNAVDGDIIVEEDNKYLYMYLFESRASGVNAINTHTMFIVKKEEWKIYESRRVNEPYNLKSLIDNYDDFEYEVIVKPAYEIQNKCRFANQKDENIFLTVFNYLFGNMYDGNIEDLVYNKEITLSKKCPLNIRYHGMWS